MELTESYAMTPAASVSTSERTAAPQRYLFWHLIENTLCRWERMLKLWKISAMLMVRNAIVTPSALSTMRGATTPSA